MEKVALFCFAVPKVLGSVAPCKELRAHSYLGRGRNAATRQQIRRTEAMLYELLFENLFLAMKRGTRH